MFINRVENLLKEKNIFAKDMLSDLEINKNQMARWKKENSVPKRTVLNAIADYLDTTPEYLLGETDIKEKTSEQTEDEELVAEFIELLNGLTDEQLKSVFDYIQFIKTKNNDDK